MAFCLRGCGFALNPKMTITATIIAYLAEFLNQFVSQELERALSEAAIERQEEVATLQSHHARQLALLQRHMAEGLYSGSSQLFHCTPSSGYVCALGLG